MDPILENYPYSGFEQKTSGSCVAVSTEPQSSGTLIQSIIYTLMLGQLRRFASNFADIFRPSGSAGVPLEL